ncbi:RNA polymerase sigma-70 factor (ECF subfamily) [Silvibacterium bohemicum]|uniref:RNA polymerase sigma factor n=1 Tax=Silvibacterium bohemicum TaxID=1577686 RepID=A0A841JXB1_9BACT|nr:sigma-70 family RNA polymerase sigma factor [Silvibacterium bohemicum]MBB6145077.1 RNA polymerase sigma-70 factor (ECF subfamily) [Silvibacterium bohemicum]
MTATETLGADAQNSSEAALIAAILAGDREKFHILILPYESQLFRTAFALVKNAEEAEDVVQDAVLKAYRKLGSFRGDAKFSTWLIAITLNEARGRLRKENRTIVDSLDEQREENADFTPAALTDWNEIPLALLERKEIRELVQQAVAELPDTYREIVTLRDVEECSVLDTAHLLGISSALVKVRLHRARMLLQKRLAPQLNRAIKASSKSTSDRPRKRSLFRRTPWF